MGLRIGLVFLLALGLMQLPMGRADTRWVSFIPFKPSVGADPNQSYELQEQDGPWLILAASFAGEGAREQAMELVLELRKRFNLPAYIDEKVFDFSESVEGKTIDRYTGGPAKMKHANYSRFDAYAVLVGNFDSPHDPALQKTLDKIKHARPDCLDVTKRQKSSQWFVGLRQSFQRVNHDPAKRSKGPMGSAFATRNPHLPEEYFATGALDDFVLKLNQNVEHSLLKNPGRFTVRVASFSGKDTMNTQEIEDIQRTGKVTDKLDIAADKAHRLTVALRAKGVDAYEFHDRIESFVTVGSFESVGEPRADGKIEIHPTVHKVMQVYGATRREIPGHASLGLQPRTLAGITFDVQPLPVEVPRRSIGADYARRQNASR